MCHHNGRDATRHDGESKYFPRMNQDTVQGSNGDQVMTFDAPACIEHEHRETFAIGIIMGMGDHVSPPIGCSFIWSIAKVHLIGHGTIPKGDDLVFAWIGLESNGLNDVRGGLGDEGIGALRICVHVSCFVIFWEPPLDSLHKARRESEGGDSDETRSKPPAGLEGSGAPAAEVPRGF